MGFPSLKPRGGWQAAPTRGAAQPNKIRLSIPPEPSERKAAEPKETPAWLWSLLSAIDPILRDDGCVWSDPTPQRPSFRMFCVGKPDPLALGMILLDSGLRLPVGTHLWEHGSVLRLNDGTHVANIPLSSRFRSAVLDYVDGLLKHEPDPALCDGRLDPIPRGLDDGWASVVAHDDMGGAAAVLGMQLYRQIICNPEARGGDVAEHKSPPRNLPGQGRFSLRENEARGGHILQRHVGKTEEQLKQRLTDEPHLKAASSFRDEATAEKAISATIERNQAAIDDWLKKSKEPGLPITHQSASDLGVALDRSATAVRTSRAARIVLARDDQGGFYVLTAYLL